ncbi:MAG: DoxX family protein [Pseudomonadota bacterium]
MMTSEPQQAVPGQLRILTYASGRTGLASLFILGGLSKVTSYPKTLVRMESAGLAHAELLLPAAIALEVVGGLIVAFTMRGVCVAAGMLAVYTLAINGFLHRFWELEEPLRSLELSLFFKNVSIAGALLMVASTGPSRTEKLKGALR